MKQRIVIVILAIVAWVGSGCASSVQATEPVPSLTIAATATPVPTVEPTLTLIPTPANGKMEGVLKDGITGDAVAGAGVILCGMAADNEENCTIDSDLVAITDGDGKFLLPDISSGAYMVLYNPQGEPASGWQALDGKELDLSEKNWKCLLDVYQKLGIYPDCTDFQMFNIGAEAMFMPPGSKLNPVTGKNGDLLTIATAASFLSRQYGVQLDFYEGEPLLVTVKPGQSASIEIKAWKAE
jgi:hypothetical protein